MEEKSPRVELLLLENCSAAVRSQSAPWGHICFSLFPPPRSEIAQIIRFLSITDCDEVNLQFEHKTMKAKAINGD